MKENRIVEKRGYAPTGGPRTCDTEEKEVTLV